MSRRTRYAFFSSIRNVTFRRTPRATSGPQLFRRRLRFEPLEDRQLLAGVVVGNNLDLVNGDTTTIANLVGNDGGDGISLREAILAANATAGADEVTFAAALSGQTITLGGTDLGISEALAIDARPLAADVTINANQLSRIFNITASSGDFTLGGLTLTGGNTTALGGDDQGGAVRSNSSGNLMIDQSTISGNRTGDFGNGGGIFAQGAVTLTQSTVSGNSVAGNFGGGGGGVFSNRAVTLIESIVAGNISPDRGGGIRSGGVVMLTRSIVSGNSGQGGGGIYTTGNVTLSDSTVNGNRVGNDRGGGIFSQAGVTLTRSTVSGNSGMGPNSNSGGGIFAGGPVTLTESTVSGNSALNAVGGIQASGAVTLTRSTVSGNTAGNIGGINAGTVTLIQSTVSGNRATTGNGGGISTGGVTITQSTVTNNHAGSMGGGVFQFNLDSNLPSIISGSIVAGNTSGGGGPDFVKDPQSTLTVNYSLIGTGIAPTAGGNNVATNNPQLAPLNNNGGPNPTHATLATSLAINAGDPGVVFNPAEFDQRGAPFVRVFGGRMDAGAYERQTVTGQNLVVDNAIDEYDGDFSAGNFSLREAIGVANGILGADTVTFAAAMSEATIALIGREIDIPETLTIDARPLAVNVTIDAQHLSRIFNITATTGDFTLGGLLITGGRITGDNSSGAGGAIRSITTGSLTIDQSAVSASRTTGDFAPGGGIYAQGNVTLTQSTVSGNSTAGVFSNGGGIHSLNDVTLSQSTLSGNSTAAPNTPGGGIFADDVTLTQSSVSGNTVTGSGSKGGALRAYGVVTLIQSTVSGNGGGIFLYEGFGSSLTITGSILAGNGTDFTSSVPNPSLSLSANFSLIGSGITPDAGGVGNVVTDNPMLAPLAFNGGPTQTRALLAGSPAIDVGDPSIIFNPAQFDQRGAPFGRVFGGRIDIGAVERQPIPAAVFGDYNQNGEVDAADYVLWRKTLGSNVANYSGADGDGDGTIDQDDHGVWRAHFGQTIGAGSGEQRAESGTIQESSVESQGSRAGLEALAEPVGVGQAVPDILNEAHVLDISILRQAEPDLHASAALRASRPNAAAMLRRDDGLLAWLAAQELGDDPREAMGLMSNSDDETRDSTAAAIDQIDALFESLHDFELQAVQ